MPFWKWFKGYKAKYDVSKSNPPALTDEFLENNDIIIPKIKFEKSYHGGSPDLKKILSKAYSTSLDNVFIGNSASDINDTIFDAFITKKDEILVESPVYPPLLESSKRRAKMVGAKVKVFHRKSENGFQTNLDELSKLINKKTKLVVMTNLHNPAGVKTDERTIEEISNMLPKTGILMVDEVYIKYCPGLKSASRISDKAIITDSLTKYYGIFSLRTGWAVGNKKNIEELESVKGYRGVVGSAYSEDLTAMIMQHEKSFDKRTKRLLDRNYKTFEEWVSGREDIELVKPDGHICCFPKLLKVKDTLDFADYLIQNYDTLFTPGEIYGLKGHIRVCFGGKPDILEKALENLGKALNKY